MITKDNKEEHVLEEDYTSVVTTIVTYVTHKKVLMNKIGHLREPSNNGLIVLV